MRAVVQRVSRASVSVHGRVVGTCGPGLLILLGVARGDDAQVAKRLAERVARLRVFESDTGLLDRSVLDAGGETLVVSQFTLLADATKGNRPSLAQAAPAGVAEPLVRRFCEALRELELPVQTGIFGARMAVELLNDGPVTIILDA